MNEDKGFELWLRENTILKDSSIRQYVSQINSHIENLMRCVESDDVSIINKVLIKEFRDKNSNTKKPAFKHFFRFKNKHSFNDQIVNLKKKPEKKIHNWLSENEISIILNGLSNNVKLIIGLQFRTGLRIREILTLQKKNVILKDDHATIMVYTKTNKAVYKNISLNDYNNIMNVVPKFEDYFFLIKPSNFNSIESVIRTTYNRINEELRNVSFNLLSKKISTHDIRRSVAEIMLKKDNTIIGMRNVQKYLGHTNLAMTIKYFPEFF